LKAAISDISFIRANGILVFILTITFSLMMIRAPGTSDVLVWRDWMNTAYQDGLVQGYSHVIESAFGEPGGGDYPPVSFAILYLTRIFGDIIGLPQRGSIKVLILIFQFLSAGLILLISRDVWMAAAFNTSILVFSVCLGYLDVCLAPWLILAFSAFRSERHVLGTAFFLLACLIKWQPLIVAPFIAIYLLQISDLQSLWGSLARSSFWKLVMVTGVTILAVTLLFGYTPLLSLRNAMGHLYLSGNALNVPWIVGCLVTLLLSSSFSIRVDEFPIILAPSTVYLIPVKVMFFVLFATVLVRAMRSELSYQNCLLFSLTGFVTYVMWNAGVHENHWFVAVILAYMLVLHSRTREHWTIATMITIMGNINLFTFYGLTGTPEIQSRVIGIDLSMILAELYALAWLFLVAYTFRASSLKIISRDDAFKNSPTVIGT
jgi:hypothetical protein